NSSCLPCRKVFHKASKIPPACSAGQQGSAKFQSMIGLAKLMRGGTMPRAQLWPSCVRPLLVMLLAGLLLPPSGLQAKDRQELQAQDGQELQAKDRQELQAKDRQELQAQEGQGREADTTASSLNQRDAQ